MQIFKLGFPGELQAMRSDNWNTPYMVHGLPVPLLVRGGGGGGGGGGIAESLERGFITSSVLLMGS